MLDLDTLDFTKGQGLVTVVAQDARTGVVLMVAHADREALERTIETGEMHYRSRTRGLWHKGATSGNTQRVVSLAPDCDGDAVLARIVPAGPACHTGATSCFGSVALHADALASLDATVADRQRVSPGEGEASYTRRLLADRNLRLKKLGEEAAELVTACADADPSRAAEEAADLVYHTVVALRAVGASLDDVRAVLALRAGRPPR
jgi:phosphoribosyl-ATP pyrophosphohydrolase/phosphoribosyl-AMP cyclohydrolase